MNTIKNYQQQIINIAQTLLITIENREEITPSLIAAKVDLAASLDANMAENFNREAAIEELIRRFSLWIGQTTTLKNEVGHVAWLTADRKSGWRYWPRYSDWMEKQLSYKAVESLDQVTDNILGMLEDPLRNGPWDRRGLVVGHVQSGKTGNYTGLICKAADAGYKIIIVLAGLHNNLRSQTQIRLEEGFLGYETTASSNVRNVVGVGEIDSDHTIFPNCATFRAESGDFNRRVARHLAISPEQRPWLFVVKKNKTVLAELLKWVQNQVADVSQPATTSTSVQDDLPRVRKKATNLPLLIIDDEADNASVDTGEQLFDNEGNPDEEHLPTTINRLIRRILFSFTRSAYVGYTATPFANIFIHNKGETRDDGLDLFPSSFIVNLAAPSNYIGPAKVFGLLSPNGRQAGLPLIREVTDSASIDGRSGWMPMNHKNGYLPRHEKQDQLPPSLVQAIDSFLLACAVRRLRGQRNEHSSMLVHVTRFNSTQREVHRQISLYIQQLKQRLTRNIDSENLLARLRKLWKDDFLPTTTSIYNSLPELTNTKNIDWNDVEHELSSVVQDIETRMINGTAKDALEYEEQKATGLKVIAVGGDKLARGLTLEGLTVSYFLRASRMYDTLMQMGRWFGYRPGYIDLCRLYTTPDLTEWFGHISNAAEELREEFDLMEARGGTPRDYGLKVQSHSVLMITSRLKMRTAQDLLLSFSGDLLETVVFHKRQDVLKSNFDTAKKLIMAMGRPNELDPERIRLSGKQKWKGFLWKEIAPSHIIEFLREYQTHAESYKVKSELIAEFVHTMNEAKELTKWTVALLGGGEGGERNFSPGIDIRMLKRSSNKDFDHKYTIGRLLSPRDESIDLDNAAWEAALKMTRTAWKPDPARAREGNPQEPPAAPNGPAIRTLRGFGAEGITPTPEKGLLLLYALDPELAGEGVFSVSDKQPVIAFGISFPASQSGRKVLYKVNTVEWRNWEQEYGPTE